MRRRGLPPARDRRPTALAFLFGAGLLLGAAARGSEAPLADAVAPPGEPLALAAGLVELGPRVPGSAAHAAARELLLRALEAAGLEQVRAVPAPGGLVNLEGLLPGREPDAGEVVLAAHYDTVAGSPGAADDASGCAVLVAAVVELRRTPLRRTVRLLLFDGEESGLEGSRAWARSLDPAARNRVLASVHLDVVGIERAGAPVVLDAVAAARASGNAHTPGWLVHAALRAGAAVGFGFRVGDRHLPLAAQILGRSARVAWSSDAAAIHAAGIPSLLLTDFAALDPYPFLHDPADELQRLDGDRLARWVAATAAVVRRLDALDGRPLPEDEFLALAGRVWIRRDLLWVGFALWVGMVLLGRPGRWAGARTEERRARGRSYLPGYLFRLGFLLAAIWIPALAAPLLYPLAPLSLVSPRGTLQRGLLVAAGCVPLLAWLLLLAWAAVQGLIAAFALDPAQALLLAGVVGTFGWQTWARD